MLYLPHHHSAHPTRVLFPILDIPEKSKGSSGWPNWILALNSQAQEETLYTYVFALQTEATDGLYEVSHVKWKSNT